MIGKCVGQDAGPARVSAVEALSERLQETKQTKKECPVSRVKVGRVTQNQLVFSFAVPADG